LTIQGLARQLHEAWRMNTTLRCEQVMSRNPLIVRQDDSLEVAAQCMRDERVGFLAVVDGTGRLAGVITDRDLAVRGVGEAHIPRETKVSAIMSRGPLTCEPCDRLDVVERRMAEHKLERMLVVDSGGRLVGVLSLTDLARCTEKAELAELFYRIRLREQRPSTI
jgi:CBS domain-containing protein